MGEKCRNSVEILLLFQVAWADKGGLVPGARVWVQTTDADVGWVRAQLIRKEEGRDGAVDFYVEEEEDTGVSPWARLLIMYRQLKISCLRSWFVVNLG